MNNLPHGCTVIRNTAITAASRAEKRNFPKIDVHASKRNLSARHGTIEKARVFVSRRNKGGTRHFKALSRFHCSRQLARRFLMIIFVARPMRIAARAAISCANTERP